LPPFWWCVWSRRPVGGGGGIIPAADAAHLKRLGVAAVFTPKDFRLNAIMRRIVGLVGDPAP
jgi:ethylmalonyl-CoA mutase